MEAEEQEHDELPFALAASRCEKGERTSCAVLDGKAPSAIEYSLASPVSIHGSVDTAALHESSCLSAGSSQPPGLDSSIVSSPGSTFVGDEEESSSTYTSGSFADSSLLQPDSQFLDAAASLLNSSSRMRPWGQSQAHNEPLSGTLTESSTRPVIDHQADDAPQTTTKTPQHLPSLLEDQSLACSTTRSARQRLSPSHQQESVAQLKQQNSEEPTGRVNEEEWEPLYGSGTIISAAPPAPDSSVYRSDERRMASLAGATACRTGDYAFRVSVDLSAGAACTARDVMDILGNPDLLRLWCDPVRDLVITKSSEGSRNATDVYGRREYDGEWVEATTSQLMVPRNTNCMYATSRSISTALGFPTYGKITMFVERQRGQVGLSIGPFPGNIEVSHNIQVFEVNGKLRIQDDVRLQKDDSNDGLTFCGIFDLFEKLFLPKVDDYIDQVLSSTARLRFLIEKCESSIHASSLNGGRDASNDPLLGGYA